MTFAKIYQDSSLDDSLFLHWKEGRAIVDEKRGTQEENRHLLALLFEELSGGTEGGSSRLREIWCGEAQAEPRWDLPLIIASDAFLQMYAEGEPVSLALFRKLYSRSNESFSSELSPLRIGKTEEYDLYHGVKSVPPGVKAKLSSQWRKKSDPELLNRVQSDLNNLVQIDNNEERIWLTLTILSHGAAYRELHGMLLYVPSTVEKDVLVPYALSEHLIWEGVKTISMRPLDREHVEPGIYLCQGTEIWPSQPLMLGSIFANLSTHGSATEPYAHSWRQIHKHLRSLQKGGPRPIVAGHSMGGALATQIALYSHPLISMAYAFNPPVVEERDFQVFHRLSDRAKAKLLVFANIDDLPFWRIGSCVIGKVHLLLGEKRWKYYPFKEMDRFLVIPALIKAFRNLMHLVPAHQNIVPLMKTYCLAVLSEEEIRRENEERVNREDKISFFPKMYKVVRFLMEFTRRHFRWEKRREYLLSQLEIIELHEQDLQETLTMTGSEDISQELSELHLQKVAILKDLGNL
jgi:pimeloyl-ACP methyl ester carboxylesterase